MEKLEPPHKINPEELADDLIRQMVDSGEWEQLRVNLAGILNVNHDYERVKERAQEIINTPQIKQWMSKVDTNEIEISEESKGFYRKMFFLNGRFCGGILIGNTSKSVEMMKAYDKKAAVKDEVILSLMAE